MAKDRRKMPHFYIWILTCYDENSQDHPEVLGVFTDGIVARRARKDVNRTLGLGVHQMNIERRIANQLTVSIK